MRPASRRSPAVRRGVTATAAVLSTLLCVGAPAIAGAPLAGAATPPSSSDLNIQARQIQAQVVSSSAALHAMAETVAQARQRLSTYETALAADDAALAALKSKLSAASSTLRSIAINQYMQDTQTVQLTAFWGSPDVMATTATYRQLATTSESNAIGTFSEAATAVQQEEGVLAGERAAASAAYSSETSRYSALQAAAQSLQAQLAKVRAQQAALAAQGPPAGVQLSNLVSSDSSYAEDMYRLRVCESGDNYQDNTGNGYYGAYQFSMSTWQGLGYSGLPSDAPPAQQDAGATTLQHEHGWGEWPACAAMLGLD